MFLMTFNPGVSELLTNAGELHVIPNEVVEQAEEHELLSFAARWAHKAHLIDRQELSEALGLRA